MSDIPTDYRDRLDLREQIARIDRAQAEAEKLRQETQKFVSEGRKLMSEGRKYRWDPFMLLMGALITGTFLRLPEILHAFGVGK